MTRKKTNLLKHEKDLAIVHKSNQLKIEKLKEEGEKLKKETKDLLNEVDGLLKEKEVTNLAELPCIENKISNNVIVDTENWRQVVKNSKDHLACLGVDEPINSMELLTEEEVKEIATYFNQPLYDRIPWDKWDFLVGFGAGVVGALIDIFLGTPGKFVQKAMNDKNNWLGSQMEKIHSQHSSNAPIDYQGEHFGGGDHRSRTIGHDLFRPFEGIRQFKDGAFKGFYFHNGVKYMVESGVNQYGYPYEPFAWAEAAIKWIVHNFCDFFSSKSIPIPGTSWLYESSNRDVRLFVEKDLYQHGINLKYVTLQTLAPISVEVGIRGYFAIRYKNLEVEEKALLQKRSELLALAHSLTIAANIGKVILLEDPTLINMPAIIWTMKRLLGLIIMENNRNSFIAKARRNLVILKESQDRLEAIVFSRIQNPILLS